MEFSLSHIAELVSGNIIGDPAQIICGVAPFESASGQEITVAGNVKFLKKIDTCAAAAVIVPRNIETGAQNLLQVDIPMVAFAKIIDLFHPPVEPQVGVHPSAFIGREFAGGTDFSIAPLVAVGNGVTIGHRCRILSGSVIGDNVEIGDDVIIHPNVTILDRCRIGNRVIIHSGTVIGSDGFGFAPDGEVYHKIQQTGIVQIGDDVEIGANNTIDRATFGKTLIGKGVKTDDLVHIGHNVQVGDNTVIVAQVGIAGSSSIGKNVILAGKAAIAGHLKIGDGATVGPMCGVAKPVPAGAVVMGQMSEMPFKSWLRVQRTLPKLPELKKRLDALEKQFKELAEKK